MPPPGFEPGFGPPQGPVLSGLDQEGYVLIKKWPFKNFYKGLEFCLIMDKLHCSSCRKEIVNDVGSVNFVCPACDKAKVVRCKNCREISARYLCGCGFTGPN